MRTIIAGSRTITDLSHVKDAVDACGWEISEVVSGCAPGVDTLGEEYANANKIPIAKFPADWSKYRRAAGPIRNQQMADRAEALIAVWDGSSTGTADMIKRAKHAKLHLYIHHVRPHSLKLEEFE